MTLSTVYPNKSQVSQACDLSGLKGLPLWFGRMRQVSLRGRGLWGLEGWWGGGRASLGWWGGEGQSFDWGWSVWGGRKGTVRALKARAGFCSLGLWLTRRDTQAGEGGSHPAPTKHPAILWSEKQPKKLTNRHKGQLPSPNG